MSEGFSSEVVERRRARCPQHGPYLSERWAWTTRAGDSEIWTRCPACVIREGSFIKDAGKKKV